MLFVYNFCSTRAPSLNSTGGDTITLAPADRPASKPNQRSLKKMWALISPARGAPGFFGFAFTRAGAALHITRPPPGAPGPPEGRFFLNTSHPADGTPGGALGSPDQ